MLALSVKLSAGSDLLPASLTTSTVDQCCWEEPSMWPRKTWGGGRDSFKGLSLLSGSNSVALVIAMTKPSLKSELPKSLDDVDFLSEFLSCVPVVFRRGCSSSSSLIAVPSIRCFEVTSTLKLSPPLLPSSLYEEFSLLFFLARLSADLPLASTSRCLVSSSACKSCFCSLEILFSASLRFCWNTTSDVGSFTSPSLLTPPTSPILTPSGLRWSPLLRIWLLVNCLLPSPWARFSSKIQSFKVKIFF